MPQSLCANYLHVVFSTMDRRPVLRDVGIRLELHGMVAGISNSLNSPAIQVGGVEDHLHALVRLNRTMTVSDWVKETKRRSTVWAQGRDKSLAEFRWQAGFGAFSVSAWDVDSVRGYIENQIEHHRTASFQDEFVGLLTRYGVEWDPKYIWD